MEFEIGKIRKALLDLEDGSKEGFFIEIKPATEIVFHREGSKIIIRNRKNLSHNRLAFDRENLNMGLNDKEKDYSFGIFLENLKNNLDKLGL